MTKKAQCLVGGLRFAGFGRRQLLRRAGAFGIAAAGTDLLLHAAPPAAASDVADAPARLSYMLGYIANDATAQADLASIESWLGRKLDCCGGTMTLSGWWQTETSPDIDVCGVAFPMLTLPGWDHFDATDMAMAAAGAYDAHYIAAAQALAQSGARIYSIRPGWEMNGNWYPWSIGNPAGQNNTAANYIATFRRIVTIVRQYLPGVLIEFCTAWAWGAFTYPPGSIVADAGTPETYWPGAAYVDIVSMDFYEQNCGSWTTVQSGAGVAYHLDWLVGFAAQNGVRIGVSEWGAARDDGSFVASAGAWMNSLGSKLAYAVYSSYPPADPIVLPGAQPNEQSAWVAVWGNSVYAG